MHAPVLTMVSTVAVHPKTADQWHKLIRRAYDATLLDFWHPAHATDQNGGLLDFYQVLPVVEAARMELGLHGLLHATVEKLMPPQLKHVFADEQRVLHPCLSGVYHANFVHFVGAWSMERLLTEEGHRGKQERLIVLKEFTTHALNPNIFLARGTDSLVHGSIWRLAQHVFRDGAVEPRRTGSSNSAGQLLELRTDAAKALWRVLLDEVDVVCLHRGGHLLQACLHGIGHGAFYAVAAQLPDSPLANFTASRVLWAVDCREPPPSRALTHTLQMYGTSALRASLAICSAAPVWEYRRGCDNGVMHSAARHGYMAELSWMRPPVNVIASPANYEAAVARCGGVSDTSECEAFVMGCGTPNGGANVAQVACHLLTKLDCKKVPAASYEGCARQV